MRPGNSPSWSKAVVILGIVVLCAATPGIAGARITVPPGATEGDQYFEEVPNGAGSGSPDRGRGGGGGAGSAGSQAVAATGALNALGPEGQAAADLANSNRPPQQGASKGSATKGSANAQPSSSTEGEGGMGTIFPILIVVTALAAIAYGLRRRLTPA